MKKISGIGLKMNVDFIGINMNKKYLTISILITALIVGGVFYYSHEPPLFGEEIKPELKLKTLKDISLWLMDQTEYFEGKRESVWSNTIDYPIDLTLASRNMKELKGGIKRSWDKIGEYGRPPYIYEINGKKYVGHNISDIKNYIKGEENYYISESER